MSKPSGIPYDHIEKQMNKPSDEDVKEMVAALLMGGDPKAEFGVNGLRVFCRSAARMIKELRPDISFEQRNGEHS